MDLPLENEKTASYMAGIMRACRAAKRLSSEYVTHLGVCAERAKIAAESGESVEEIRDEFERQLLRLPK